MSAGLTKQQAALLTILRAMDVTPSYAEMGALIGTVKSRVSVILDALEERGFIERLPGRHRAVKVLDTPKSWYNDLEEFSTPALIAELQRRGMAVSA